MTRSPSRKRRRARRTRRKRRRTRRRRLTATRKRTRSPRRTRRYALAPLVVSNHQPTSVEYLRFEFSEVLLIFPITHPMLFVLLVLVEEEAIGRRGRACYAKQKEEAIGRRRIITQHHLMSIQCLVFSYETNYQRGTSLFECHRVLYKSSNHNHPQSNHLNPCVSQTRDITRCERKQHSTETEQVANVETGIGMYVLNLSSKWNSQN
jgi:hypothetical protein